MREVMASAVVGDDVLREDPTVNGVVSTIVLSCKLLFAAALEDRCARLLGTEAALYTPTASMANLISGKCFVAIVSRCMSKCSHATL